MNAPQQAAICPTCKGSGYRMWAFDRTLLGGKRGKREQRCLACRGEGYVEPGRVCATCGNWNDVCTCPKSKIIKLEMRDMGEQTGVQWNSRDKRWKATIYREGKTHYLGQYKDQSAAISIRLKAEQIPPSEYPALMDEYAPFRGKGGKPAPSEDVIEAEVPDLDAADMLHQKLVAAREADQRFQAIREQYCAAERDAVDAWNEYARELAASGQSDAFARSYLGFLREEINRP